HQFAYWRDKFMTEKDGEFDKITLIGNASFVDKQDDQRLAADTLIVWLEGNSNNPPAKPADAKNPPKDAKKAPEPANKEQARPTPVEARGQVLAPSKGFHAHAADKMVALSRDAPPGAPVPPPATGARAAAPPAAGQTAPPPAATAPQQSGPGAKAPVPAPNTA